MIGLSPVGLEYLSVPKFVSAGTHTRDKTEYRFMVMERFGDDIEKLFCSCGRLFNLKTVCYLALRLVSYKVKLSHLLFIVRSIRISTW